LQAELASRSERAGLLRARVVRLEKEAAAILDRVGGLKLTEQQLCKQDSQLSELWEKMVYGLAGGGHSDS
jgi:hypothetical protein